MKNKNIVVGILWLAANLSSLAIGFYVGEYNKQNNIQTPQPKLERQAVQKVPDPVWELQVMLIETCPIEAAVNNTAAPKEVYGPANKLEVKHEHHHEKGERHVYVTTTDHFEDGCTFIEPKSLKVAEDLLLQYGFDLDFTEAVSNVPSNFGVEAEGIVTEAELTYIETHAVAEHRNDNTHLYLLNTKIHGGQGIMGLYLPGGDYVISNYLIGDEETKGFVIAHEIVHALGLGHVDDVNNLMYPYDVEGSLMKLELWQTNLMKAFMNATWQIKPEKYDG